MVRPTLVALAALLSAPLPAATPQSSIDRTAIKEVIARHMPAIRRCYEAALARQPGLAGRMLVRFSITASGHVSSAAVVQSTLQAPEMEACVLGVVRQMVFPPHHGADVTISYPFVFRSP